MDGYQFNEDVNELYNERLSNRTIQELINYFEARLIIDRKEKNIA
jgi:hypothetical protein